MDSILEVKNIHKSYIKGKSRIQAVQDVSFKVYEGECLGLVGGSGCGKSTIAKIITRLQTVDKGKIFLNGKEITYATGKKLKDVYKEVQMVFQSPIDSFNPRLKLGEGLMESMMNQGISKGEAKKKAEEYLEICGLPKEFMNRYPYQVSGGQCQRASIARAIAVKPSLLICDEATSALDVTVQSQIVQLMEQLKKEMKMAYLFISHDIALVQEICDRMLVMDEGHIVEAGFPHEIIMNPKNDYTKKLIDSIF